MELLASFKEIGIAISSIVIFAYIVKYIIDKNQSVFNSLIEQLRQNRVDYTLFVETNNHANTERIEKSTEAMVKISSAIEQHTRVLEKLLDKINFTTGLK